MSDARTVTLARIATATAGTRAPTWSREYRRTGTLGCEARVQLFAERVREYRATVVRVAADRVADSVAVGLGDASRVGVPLELPFEWLPPEIERVADTGLSPRELDGLDGVVTGCTVAIAETGTIVLTSGMREGTRALTLVPDLHVCIVEADQIVELVPEALAAIAERTTRPITLVSGPSATSDIELSRVEGVHGPRRLFVVITSVEESDE